MSVNNNSVSTYFLNHPFTQLKNSEPNITWFVKSLNWFNFMNSSIFSTKDFMSNMSWSADVFQKIIFVIYYLTFILFLKFSIGFPKTELIINLKPFSKLLAAFVLFSVLKSIYFFLSRQTA